MTDTGRVPPADFVGHEPRRCGEHRTVGPLRAWCYDCVEWCYPRMPCARCDVPRIAQTPAAMHVPAVLDALYRNYGPRGQQ